MVKELRILNETSRQNPEAPPTCSSSQAGRIGSSCSNNSAPGGGQESEQPQGLAHAEDAAEHEHMKAVLRTSLSGGDREVSTVPGLRTRTRSRPGRGGEERRSDLKRWVFGHRLSCYCLCRSNGAGVDPGGGGRSDLRRRRRG